MIAAYLALVLISKYVNFACPGNLYKEIDAKALGPKMSEGFLDGGPS
jgi:hypothetical protein